MLHAIAQVVTKITSCCLVTVKGPPYECGFANIFKAKLWSTVYEVLMRRRCLWVYVSDMRHTDVDFVEGSICQCNSDTLTKDDPGLGGIVERWCFMTIQHPTCLLSEIHFHIKDNVASYLPPSHRCRMGIVNYFKGNANVLNFLSYGILPVCIAVVGVYFVGLSKDCWNFDPIFMVRPSRPCFDG